jgi:hypothetical protein
MIFYRELNPSLLQTERTIPFLFTVRGHEGGREGEREGYREK